MPQRKVTLAALDDRLGQLESRVEELERAVRDDRDRLKRLKDWTQDIQDALERVATNTAPWMLQEHCTKCGRRKDPGRACRFCLPD